MDEATSDSMTELLRDVDHESVARKDSVDSAHSVPHSSSIDHLALWKESRRGLLAHKFVPFHSVTKSCVLTLYQ